MYPAAGPTAHGLIASDLTVADLDDAYLALLGVGRTAAVGGSALAFLHPDDRTTGEALLGRILESGRPLTATQRHLRADGRAVWVDVHVSRVGAQLVVTCRPLADGDPRPASVEAQWQMARLLLQALDGGKRAFGSTLIGNPATEILLLAYVAEAEARAILAEELADRIDVSWPLTRRWLDALATAGFVEAELPGPIRPEMPVRLSPRAVAMIESIFGALVAVVKGARVPG